MSYWDDIEDPFGAPPPLQRERSGLDPVGGGINPAPVPVGTSGEANTGHVQTSGGGGDDNGGFDFGSGAFPSSSINFNLPGVPRFKAPVFVGPKAADVFNDPGYQFRLSEGERALQQSAAGQGLLRSGGTLKDIAKYAQNYASQEYGNTYNRALQTFDRNYTGAKDEYSPLLLEWQARASAAQRAAELQYQRMWEEFLFNNVSLTEQQRINAGLGG